MTAKVAGEKTKKEATGMGSVRNSLKEVKKERKDEYQKTKKHHIVEILKSQEERVLKQSQNKGKQ